MMRATIFGATALLLVVGGTGAMAASPFDGVYEGAARGGGGGQCGAGVAFSLTVRDGAFNWNVEGQSTRVTIGPDGSFSAQNGRRTVAGRIADGKISATSGVAQCTYTWGLTKKG